MKNTYTYLPNEDGYKTRVYDNGNCSMGKINETEIRIRNLISFLAKRNIECFADMRGYSRIMTLKYKCSK